MLKKFYKRFFRILLKETGEQIVFVSAVCSVQFLCWKVYIYCMVP
jgi:hypothetical protein